MQLKMGELLEGRYRIEAPIARGGMSTVYRCLDTRLGRHVAAKVMDARYVHDPVFRQRFRREARSMARLSHPNLVGVYDFSSEGEHIFLIMELITGGTLRELLAERGPMPPHAAVAVMRAVLTGLRVVHEANMVHRDLKPDNILISATHQVKLSDFGLVRAASASTVASNQIVGTVSYLSPEQVTGDDITEASDVYSAGIVLFELLTGSTPFRGENQIEHAYARLDSPVPAPSSKISGIPKLIDELVASACAFDPNERFADATEFLAALDDVAYELALPAFTVPVPQNAAAFRAATEMISTDDHTEMFTTAIPKQDPSAEGVTEVITDPDQLEMPTTVFPPTPPVAGTGSVPEETGVLDAHGFPVNPQGAHAAGSTAPAAGAAAGAGAAAASLSPETAMQPRITPDVHNRAVEPMPDFAPAAVENTKPEVSNRGKVGLVLWLIVAMVLTCCVAVGAWWYGSGRYGEIPQVLGMEKTAATAALQEAGFSSEVSLIYHDEIPAESAIGTNPSAGSSTVKGDVVTLLVSRGKPTVPAFEKVKDYPSVLAEHSLTAAEGGEEYSDTVPVGEIVRVEPAVGTEVNTKTQVTVFRSKGPEPINIPSVRDRDADEAVQMLEEAGFKVEIQHRFDEQVQGDRAIETSPEAGTAHPKGSSVTVVISTASVIPEVEGMSESEARSALAEAGVRVEAVTRASDSNISGASASEVHTVIPAPGTLIDGSTTPVTIVLVAEVDVPNVVGKRVSEARRILHDAGFQVKLPSGATGRSRVYYQSPSSFSSAVPGSDIELSTF
ncbi:PASTA domain-containing protein [Corynebacterium felinum]|uniref:non-specific serine/threonine protein kinase n=1 Tax=Corynebacterium felinum TaxID=131318 RepID=A0ABU2BD22_9CORY|nr:PASTA domain-containing protein [Corynebacterium felinum]MDF5821326.1 PASTA domain-containing protein [Corynebacterium felinum]MDR7356156.1 serine/threonine-protein kinase [Corynebacterium felinum]WJY95490.1 Serine/threonine-protein kinase PknL [Corynebacterium felinum]